MAGNCTSNRFAQLCAGISGGIALMTGIGWVFGKWQFATFGPDYVPMAPLTAWMLALMSFTLFLLVRRPERTTTRWAVGVAVVAATWVCATVLMALGRDGDIAVERFLAHTSETVRDIVIGRMSPLSAACFALAALGLIFASLPFVPRRLCRGLAVVLGGLILLIGLVVVLAYIVHMPLLYGSGLVPMALITGVAFVSLGMGIVLAAGVENWLVTSGLPRWLMATFAVAVLGLVCGGTWFYHGLQANFRREAERHLQTIARLKADAITVWRTERIGDAVVFTDSEFFEEAVGRWLNAPDAATAERILVRLRATATYYHYHDVLLADTNGQVRLSLSGYRGALPEPMKLTVADTLRERQAVLTDLHVGQEWPKAHMEAIAPLFAAVAGVDEAIGVVILQSDVREFLYPLISSWPVPSATAETLLVQRDGADVLFLNDLRHRRDAALNLRIPLSRTDVPAVMAVLGKRGLVDGLDYRGVPVVSVLEAIPGSSWCLVAKMDVAEMFGPLRMRAWMTGAVVLLLIVILAMALVFLQYRFAAAEALRLREEKLAVTLHSIGDGVLATDEKGRVTRLNPVAERLTGWTGAEAMGRPVAEVFRIINEGTRQPAVIPVDEVLASGEVRGLANHTVLIARDGTERPIDDSAAPLRSAAGELLGVVLVFRDVTEHRRAEQAIRHANERLEQRVQERTAALEASERGFAWAEALTRTGHWTLDPETQAVTASDEMLHILRMDRSEVSLKAWETLIHPDDRARAIEALGTAAAQGIGWDIEHRLLFGDGSVRWVHTVGQAVQRQPGHASLLCGTTRDVTESKQVQAEVTESRQRLTLATESARMGIWDWDIVNNRMTWDDWMFRLYGIAVKPASYGVEIWEHGLHPDDKAHAWDACQAALRGEKPYDVEFRVRHADGTVRTLKANGIVLRDAGGKPMRMIGVNYDITERRQAEETIRHALAEKEALLREVHHRVKNNLQIVSSLLSLQMRHLADPGAMAALRDTDVRIRSMAMLHENLYQSEGMDRVRCGDYFRHLAVQLTAMFDFAARGIVLQIEVLPADLTLSLDKAVPCGLLVTELITNAFKHAFPAGRRGTVNVTFGRDESGRIRLRVMDDGVGLPETAGPEGRPSLGMKLVNGFVRQIRATMEIRRGPGTCFDLRFDAEES